MALLGLDTPARRTVFLLYMGLWCALRLIVYGSKHSSSAPDYNATSLLIFTCLAKLIMATGLFLQSDGTPSELIGQFQQHGQLFLRYALPSLAYVIYDNLTFVNLAMFDPVTYVILMQMRLVATGVMWSVFFGRPLTRQQWIALFCITSGCMVKEGGRVLHTGWTGSNMTVMAWAFGILSVLLQITCGVFASVFNEILLKKQTSIPVNTQNVFMYLWSIGLNILVLAVKGELAIAVRMENLRPLFSVWIFPIGIILATTGIVTSWFLKYLDSVRKSIASAIEIFVDAILTWLIFQIPIGLATLLAAILVSGGIYLYSVPRDIPAEVELPANGIRNGTRNGGSSSPLH
eukprot:NODE_2032_length_1318_cov_31.371158_g1847_i0.p1 GENE.NODE_2032_length_1318_cov_31.371158_g1847_i0~~NODE_2032_length_1318_cov_31.371158_g1847_i0.p1  ORF type:complete len:347 (+),score=65.67 NODE_2032_length_1318_cov_31.371158_g1847_i0:56-1096(+)